MVQYLQLPNYTMPVNRVPEVVFNALMTHPKEFSESTVVGLCQSDMVHIHVSSRRLTLQGFPLTYFKSLVNQNRNTSSILSNASSDFPIATKVFG